MDNNSSLTSCSEDAKLAKSWVLQPWRPINNFKLMCNILWILFSDCFPLKYRNAEKRNKYYLAKFLEDSNQDLFRGSIWELAVLLAEPTTGKSFQMDGVRPLPRQSLIHVLRIAEEGLPVMTCGEVHLILYSTNLRKGDWHILRWQFVWYN